MSLKKMGAVIVVLLALALGTGALALIIGSAACSSGGSDEVPKAYATIIVYSKVNNYNYSGFSAEASTSMGSDSCVTKSSGRCVLVVPVYASGSTEVIITAGKPGYKTQTKTVTVTSNGTAGVTFNWTKT